jgi:lysophospholipid acyltransferase (LPLAT)-like uncharacterized protein
LKNKIKDFIQVVLLPYFLSLFVRFIYLTNKKIYHHPKELSDEAFIISMWHGELLMQPFNYFKFKQNGQVKAIISHHRDGRTIQNIVKYLGIGTISGSSSRGGVKALIGAIKNISQGVDVAITPDGPRGPIYSIADGIVAISQKTDANIVPFRIKASKIWRLKSWDSFIIPKPFGIIDFYIGEPFNVKGLTMQEAKELIKRNMQGLCDV